MGISALIHLDILISFLQMTLYICAMRLLVFGAYNLDREMWWGIILVCVANFFNIHWTKMTEKNLPILNL